jgi:hypothetical protein
VLQEVDTGVYREWSRDSLKRNKMVAGVFMLKLLRRTGGWLIGKGAFLW